MIPKLRAGFEAKKGGVKKVYIANGRERNVLLKIREGMRAGTEIEE